jgi:hypothetical protein
MGREERANTSTPRVDRGPHPLDRILQPIVKGQLVVFHPENDLIMEVLDVRPILDPRPGVPPGAVRVSMTTSFEVILRERVTDQRFLVIGDKIEHFKRMGIPLPPGVDDAATADETTEPAVAPPGPPEASSGPKLVLTDRD